MRMADTYSISGDTMYRLIKNRTLGSLHFSLQNKESMRVFGLDNIGMHVGLTSTIFLSSSNVVSRICAQDSRSRYTSRSSVIKWSYRINICP